MNLTMITIFTILSRRVSPCAERLYAVAVHPSGLMWPFVPACAAGRYLDLGVDGRLDRGDAVCNGNVYSQSVYDFLKLLTASERHSKRSRVAGGGMEERASRVDRPRAGPYGRQSKRRVGRMVEPAKVRSRQGRMHTKLSTKEVG